MLKHREKFADVSEVFLKTWLDVLHAFAKVPAAQHRKRKRATRNFVSAEAEHRCARKPDQM
jgi:hypothetical protein